jgi:hypothetical protein
MNIVKTNSKKAATSPSNKENIYSQKGVFTYVVSLQNRSARYIDVFSLLLLCVSSVFFLLNAFYLVHTPPVMPQVICAVAILAILPYNIYKRRKHHAFVVFYRSALFLAAIGWVTIPGYEWLFAPFAAMAMLEKTAKLPLEIGFSDAEVVVNSLIRRHYKWQQFTNIVLKDDLLTLDFTSNRLLQRLTIDEEGDADEDEFNDYCQKQLVKS